MMNVGERSRTLSSVFGSPRTLGVPGLKMDETEARLLRDAPVLVGESALADRMRRQTLAASAANHIAMLGPEGSGQRAVALALHAGRVGPFVSVDGSVLDASAVAAQWTRARGGTLFIARAQRLTPDAQAVLFRMLQTSADDSVRVIWAGETSAFAERFAAREILFCALEARRSDVPFLVDAFLAEAARARHRPPPQIDQDGRAAIDASTVEELAERCRAVYEHFVRSEDRPDRISLKTVLATISPEATAAVHPAPVDRTAELKRLAAQLSAVDDDVGFDELHAHLCADEWLASLPVADRREALADLAMQFYSRSNRNPRYEAVLSLFMLDVLDAHPGATRNEMLAEVKNAGLTGASTNFLSKHVLARWPGMKDFSDLQAKARGLAWGPRGLVAASSPAVRGREDGMTLDEASPSPTTSEPSLPHHEESRLWATPDSRALRSATVDGAGSFPTTDDHRPIAGPEPFLPIEIALPTTRWPLVLRGLVFSTVVAVGAMLLFGRSRPAPAGRPVLPIAMGDDHLCVWQQTDAPRCWYGASHPCRALMPGSEIRVPGRARQLVAGRAHTCAMTHRGDAWCWGDHRRGQLGTASASATPCTEPSLTWRGNVARMAAHGDRTCVQVQHDGIWCMGDNHDAVLPTTATVTPAVRVSSTSAISDLIMLEHAVCWREADLVRCRHATGEPTLAISAGSVGMAGAADLLCVRTSGGEVRCWRLSADGRFAPVDVASAAGIVQLRMGRRCGGEDLCRARVCVADSKDRVFCGDSRPSGSEGHSVLRLEETDMVPDAMGVGGKADCGLIFRNPHCWPPTRGYPSAIEVETIGGP